MKATFHERKLLKLNSIAAGVSAPRGISACRNAHLGTAAPAVRSSEARLALIPAFTWVDRPRAFGPTDSRGRLSPHGFRRNLMATPEGVEPPTLRSEV